MRMAELITRAIEEALAPVSLAVIDESDGHVGHGGWRDGQGAVERALRVRDRKRDLPQHVNAALP